ncbi:MAG: FG-GAP-like repeat-containing protein, partial [Acidobacteriota bacterium]|nr:FG-GAP-like repeat-containing protein [Acidobacteriota bacterium]
MRAKKLNKRLKRGLAAALAITATLATLARAADPAARGMEAFRNRDFVAAERIFQKIARDDPGNAHAWKLLGMAYAAEEKYNLAEPAFRKACTLKIDEERACYYLARTDFTLARFDDALHFYELALKTAGANRGRVLLGMALAFEALSKPDDAELHYRQAIAAGEARARVDYGLFLFKSGRGAESLATLGKAGAIAELERVRKALAAAPPISAKPTLPGEIGFESKPLDMVVRTGATGEKHQIETMIAGVAVFDYDNDGWPDIYVANGATVPDLIKPDVNKKDSSYSNRLFRNNRDGTFSDVTGKAGVAGVGYSMGVAAADFDNDGNEDLFVTGVRGNTLFHNRGDGTFEDVTKAAGLGETGKWSVAAGWFDFDNDGLLDLFVVRYVVWDPAEEIFCGENPGYRQYCHPSNYQPLANALYRNLGNGKFQDVSVSSGIAKFAGKGMGVAFGDFDNDGHLDIFVANDTVPNFLFHNEGNGKFREMALDAGVAYDGDGKSISAMGVDFRDYDNDGREDLFITALSNETFPLFRNLGHGHFADVTYPSGIGRAAVPWTGWSAGMFDFNNDGWKDIFVAGGHVMDNAELSSSRKSRQPNVVFTNRAGRFDAKLLAGEALHRGAAFGDFDRDGRVDAVVTRLNEQPLVLRNVSAAGNWIDFRLIGHKSNRDGIGAWLHVTSESGEQWNRVTTSVGYGCSSDRVVHFGL